MQFLPKVYNSVFLFSVILTSLLWSQGDTYDSGGSLMPEQALYDVTFYELKLNIDPQTQSIAGSNTITARVVRPFSYLVLDFDASFSIDSVLVMDHDVLLQTSYERKGSTIWIDIRRKRVAGALVTAQVFYHGHPRVAPRPPWDGGFVWSSTPSGAPWVSVSCENNGADIWWPCKDHPSDEPDSMSLFFTVPKDLQCISNGQLRHIFENDNDTHTFFWFVSTPINNYGVSFYVAPFAVEEFAYESITGGVYPMRFYYLPENYGRHKEFAPQIPQHMRFLEELLGPYPFRIDKYAAVEAPYFGMEHQSCIAYGNKWGNRAFGYDQAFDPLHYHELSHEWWGNMLTAADWKDMWLHEGFATYMEALYAGHLNGQAGYNAVMHYFRGTISHLHPIGPKDSRTIGEIYGTDIYYKGAWLLHTLRYVIGDDFFFESLQRFLYPDPALKMVKDGSHCRLVSSDEFITTVERVSNQTLDWFFQVYLRQAQPPVLQVWLQDRAVHLAWKIEKNIHFPMNVPVKIGEKIHIADMSTGYAALELDPFVAPEIDPENQILMLVQRVNTLADDLAVQYPGFSLMQNFPNPFNSETTIEFTVPLRSDVLLTIRNLRGEKIAVLADDQFDTGEHTIHWDATNVPSGTYTCTLQVGEFVDVKKLTVLK
ncbi:T9SS type A sorting domain-containing protein [candidate division KSB1 bacterium]|nr:T9SS type A sorting domain-containing protein [candidate division KSB1 bacterium]